MGEQSMQGQRVFLSYAQDDLPVAERVAAAIRRSGFSVTDPRLEQATDLDIFELLSARVRASDVVVVLWKPASASGHWVQWETRAAVTDDLSRRDVDVIVARVAPGATPAALQGRPVVDLLNEAAGLRRLVEQIRASAADFSALSPQAFEGLVADLLQALGFSVNRSSGSSDAGVDFRATLPTTDPFGGTGTELWLVETKLYTHGRVSIDTITQLAAAVAATPAETRGLLVTSAHLTSAAREYAERVERDLRTSLRVLDGADLRRLLGRFPDITARYFPPPRNIGGCRHAHS